jgi:hypothetical protein
MELALFVQCRGRIGNARTCRSSTTMAERMKDYSTQCSQCIMSYSTTVLQAWLFGEYIGLSFATALVTRHLHPPGSRPIKADFAIQAEASYRAHARQSPMEYRSLK